MNLTLGSTMASRSAQRFKERSLAAACGVAIVVAGLAAIGVATQSDGNSTLAPASNALTVRAVPAAHGSVFFIVGSPAQAASAAGLIQTAVGEAYYAGSVSDVYQVIVADSPQAEARLGLLASDLNGVYQQTGAANARIIDLR